MWCVRWGIATMGLLLSSVIFAQETAGVAEVERVIVTGSNIPTAEEVGPSPVDTYRPRDIEKLGVRNATDFLTRLPQEMGDGKRVAGASLGGGAIDINLIPFSMIGRKPSELSSV